MAGKLTNQQRAAIYQAWKDGTSQSDLGKEYGISASAISQIIKKMNTQKTEDPKLEDVENGIPNTPLISANTEQNSTIAENEKFPHVIWCALDDQCSAINMDIERREERIAELQEEIEKLESIKNEIRKFIEESEWE